MESNDKALLDSYKRRSDWLQKYLTMQDLAERRIRSAKKVQKKIKQKFDELVRAKDDPAQLALFDPDDFLTEIKEMFPDLDESFWNSF
jgi:hypothetical protein